MQNIFSATTHDPPEDGLGHKNIGEISCNIRILLRKIHLAYAEYFLCHNL